MGRVAQEPGLECLQRWYDTSQVKDVPPMRWGHCTKAGACSAASQHAYA